MKNAPNTQCQDFTDLVHLMSVFSEAAASISALESSANREFLRVIDARREEYATLQATMTEAETQMEIITRRHDEWFTEKKRSIKTPYGTVKFIRSNPIVVENQELSIVLIEQEIDRQAAVIGQGVQPEFDATALLRRQTALDLEALERLPDAVLKKFRLRRESKDNFSVTPAKVDMGKAVKQAAPEEQPAAAA